jgi:hypothetical protein
MRFKNYGKAVEDCKKAFGYKKDFAKAYFRCGQVLMILKKYNEVKEVIQQGL